MESRSNISYTVYCSFLQIYNEKLFDLFQDRDSNRSTVSFKPCYSFYTPH